MLAVVISYILLILKIIIIADVLLSWLQQPDQFPRNLTSQVTEPLYAPLRAIIKPGALGGIDFSPILVFIGINVVQIGLRHAALTFGLPPGLVFGL